MLRNHISDGDHTLRIAIFLVALTLCAFAAQSQQPSPRDHSQKAKQTKINQAQAEKPAAKAVELSKDEPKARSEWWLVWLTGTLVFVAIVQAAVFYYQGRQLRETVKAARGNVDALMNAERAHLSFEHFEIVDERSPGQRFYPIVPGDANSCASMRRCRAA
jgi:glucose/arabinose dehydrogenase